MTNRLKPAAMRTPAHRPGDAGITLVEVLVVLAIIGVATGATMLGMNAADRNTRAEAEAVRLARNLSLGVDEALITGAPLALSWDAGGYSFIEWSPVKTGWDAANLAVLATRHDLRAPVVMRAQSDTTASPVLIASSGTGAAIAFEFGSTPANNNSTWIVTFDGYTATAQPQATP